MISGTILAMLAAVLWGAVYALTQKLVQRVAPIQLLAITYFIGGLLAIPVLMGQRVKVHEVVLENLGELVFYLFAVLIAEICIILSIALLGGSEASIIEVSYPMWTAIVLYLWQGEKPTTMTLIAGALIMIGVIMIAFGEQRETNSQVSSVGPQVPLRSYDKLEVSPTSDYGAV